MSLISKIGAFLGIGRHKKVEQPKEENNSKTLGLEGSNQYNQNEGLEIEHNLDVEPSITATVQEEKASVVKKKTFTNPETGEQTVHEYTYDGLGRKTHTQVSTGETMEYSYNGNSKKPSELVHKDADGNVVSKFVYTYNAQGDLINTKEFDAEGNLYSNSTPELPEADIDGGTLAEASTTRIKSEETETTDQVVARTFTYDNGNPSTRHEYTYDEQGRKTHTQTSTGESFDYKYADDSNNPSEFIAYDANGNKTGSQLFAYDSNGNKTKTQYFDANGQLELTQQLYYAENGQVNKKETLDADGNIIQSESTIYLADGGKEIHTARYDNGQVAYQDVVQYNAQGEEVPVQNNYLAQNE